MHIIAAFQERHASSFGQHSESVLCAASSGLRLSSKYWKRAVPPPPMNIEIIAAPCWKSAHFLHFPCLIYPINSLISSFNSSSAYFITSLSSWTFSFIFQAIGSLPSLEHLRVGSSGLSGTALQLVSTAISFAATHLQSLTLQSIHFRASIQHISKNPTNTRDDEFVEFCQQIFHVYPPRSILASAVQRSPGDQVDLGHSRQSA